jgi:lipoprotein-anchoring transpeptidase ErfK/SrfK
VRKILHVVGAFAVAVAATLLTGFASAEAAGAPCAYAASACVDLSTQQAWLMNNGQVTYGPTPITSGRPGEGTPIGRFNVQWKDRDHYSREYNNAPMPYSVFFTTTGVAFHEGSLQRQSGGCVHLGHDAAVTFFDRLGVGQEVQVVQ